jgi:hypothetical protein
LITATITIVSCEKDKHVPPNITFKTGAGYTASDATAATSAAILFGVDVEKTEDELNTFDVSVSFDGGTAISIQTEAITGSEEDGFNRDVNVTTRTVAGTEKYTFTVTDRDGNIAQESLTITVQ